MSSKASGRVALNLNEVALRILGRRFERPGV
jgi:hypothetical protein